MGGGGGWVGWEFQTFQKQIYILKTSLQGSLGKSFGNWFFKDKIRGGWGGEGGWGRDQENIGDENIGEVELRYLIGERQIKMDIFETAIEVSAEEL